MSSQNGLKVWDDRMQALDDTMTSMTKRYSSSSAPRMQSLSCLVRCLQAFGKSQFRFFYDGFSAGKEYLLANGKSEYAEHVLSVILDQIAFDMDVIQRAADQRISAGDPNNPSASALRDTLERADKFAWDALQPVMPPNQPATGTATSDRKVVLDSRTTVVTYFQKSPSIRVIPYAPVAFTDCGKLET